MNIEVQLEDSLDEQILQPSRPVHSLPFDHEVSQKRMYDQS